MDDTERIALATGTRPNALEPVEGHGAPSHRRWRVHLDDRPPAFAKVAAFDYVAEWLRLEHGNYVALGDKPFLPELIGWHDDGASPVLVIEDLSEARWPPPWSSDDIDAVLSALDEIQGTPPPAEIDDDFGALFDIHEGWDPMRADPTGALGLGVFDRLWFERYAGDLADAAATAELGGDCLLHGDVRSDNLCVRDGRAVLIDWNWACVGARELDLASWLPSLHHEGGPEPWTMLPDAGPLAALLAGFFLEHAAREPIPQAPHVRQLQLDQGVVALRWACKELAIPDA
jgi:Phosphotransferase enzyme family